METQCGKPGAATEGRPYTGIPSAVTQTPPVFVTGSSTQLNDNPDCNRSRAADHRSRSV
jgi:hypothetical protein